MTDERPPELRHWVEVRDPKNPKNLTQLEIAYVSKEYLWEEIERLRAELWKFDRCLVAGCGHYAMQVAFCAAHTHHMEEENV